MTDEKKKKPNSDNPTNDLRDATRNAGKELFNPNLDPDEPLIVDPKRSNKRFKKEENREELLEKKNDEISDE